MSVTADLQVAVQYGLSAGELLFMLKVDNFLQLGAELQWVSAFPGEAEVLYPPLTHLRPVRQADGEWEVVHVMDDGRMFAVVEVVPSECSFWRHAGLVRPLGATARGEDEGDGDKDWMSRAVGAERAPIDHLLDGLGRALEA